MRIFTIVTICLLSISCAFAQEKGEKKGQDFDHILSTKIAFFTSELNLTPDEAVQFWAVYNQGWENMMKESHNVRKSLKALRRAMESTPKKSSAEIKNLMNEYFKACRKDMDTKEVLFEELCKVVPVEKAAKTFIAEEKFRVYLIKNLRGQGEQGHKHAEQAPGKKPQP